MKEFTLTEAVLRCMRLLADNDDPGNTSEGVLDEETRAALYRVVSIVSNSEAKSRSARTVRKQHGRETAA